MQHTLCLTQYLGSTCKNQTCAHSMPSQCLHLVGEKNKRWPECGSVSRGASGLPPPAPFLTFCHTFGGGHISSSPQPNYSTTHLAAIKRCTAGVRGSCVEPGCCHGHCHSADFQGRKANAAISHRKMLVVLF